MGILPQRIVIQGQSGNTLTTEKNGVFGLEHGDSIFNCDCLYVDPL